MSKATRNIEFRLYPSAGQVRTLLEWLDLHRELYNAALEERRDAFHRSGICLTYNQQQNELPAVKSVRPELIPLGSHALQETVRRVDRAYKAFFRRIKAGEKPGFPRFKGRHRYDSFTYPDPAGWKILEQADGKGRLRIGNLGTVRMRGTPRVALGDGEPRTLTIRRKDGKWYAIIGVRYDAGLLARNCAFPGRAVGLDAGCKDVVFTSDGDPVANPKELAAEQGRLKQAQRELARKKRGSNNRNKTRAKLARIHRKIADRRKDFLHQLSACAVFLYAFIAIENLALKNLTRSSRGTVSNPGGNVKQKAGLNRSMLDASIGLFFSMLAYKAEEAGVRLEKVPPHGTTQNCARCGNRVPKTLSDRIHDCPHCGFVAHRDHNAALNILLLGLTQAGREPSEVWRNRAAGPAKHETASMQQHGGR